MKSLTPLPPSVADINKNRAFACFSGFYNLPFGSGFSVEMVSELFKGTMCVFLSLNILQHLI